MQFPDIPTAISHREAALLSQVARDRTVVEFGTLLGFSTIVMARTARHVISVDKHKDYSGPTFQALIRNLRANNVNRKVTTIQGDALDWAPRLPCDLAFIDLTGEYDLTKSVLDAIKARWVLVHDVTRPNCRCEAAILDAGWIPVSQVDTTVLATR